MQGLLDRFSEAVVHYGSWGVFAMAVLEEVIAPIPSTLTIMGAAFVMLAPYKTFTAAFFPALFYIAIPTSLGVAIGGLLVYGLAYYSGKAIIDRWGKWFGLSWSSVEKMQKYFESGHRDEAVLTILRIIPIFPNSLISAVCGLLRYPAKPFFIFSFVGGVPRALLIALLGWWAESAYATYASVFSTLENYAVGFFAVIGLVAVAWLILRKQKNENS